MIALKSRLPLHVISIAFGQAYKVLDEICAVLPASRSDLEITVATDNTGDLKLGINDLLKGRNKSRFKIYPIIREDLRERCNLRGGMKGSVKAGSIKFKMFNTYSREKQTGQRWEAAWLRK